MPVFAESGLQSGEPSPPPDIERPPWPPENAKMSLLPSKDAVLRAAIVVCAFIATSLLMVAVGALFEAESRQPWLRDTPAARQAVASCDAHGARVDAAVRQRCVRGLVAAAHAPDAAPTRLAAR